MDELLEEGGASSTSSVAKSNEEESETKGAGEGRTEEDVRIILKRFLEAHTTKAIAEIVYGSPKAHLDDSTDLWLSVSFCVLFFHFVFAGSTTCT